MIEINLLPWREEKRRANQKQLSYLLFATVVLSFCITLLVNFYLESLLQNQGIRNQLLKREQLNLNKELTEIKKLETTYKNTVEKITTLTNQFNERVAVAHLLNELPNFMPSGVYLTKFELENNRVLIKGYSNSNADIALMMRRLETASFLQKINLNNIANFSSDKAEKGREFLLACTIKQNME